MNRPGIAPPAYFTIRFQKESGISNDTSNQPGLGHTGVSGR
jgi:hypothetical protein